MAAEPLLEFPQVCLELASFLAAFAAAGAVGFRLTLRGAVNGGRLPPAETAGIPGMAARSARLGLAGLGLAAILLAYRLPALAARRHATVSHLLTTDPALILQVTLLALGLVGFALAASRRDAGWLLAGLAVLGLPLRGLVTGDPLRLVNPLHVLAGGLWIGTLFHLWLFGIRGARGGHPGAKEAHGLVAALVRAFSPLALGGFGLLAVLGVVTAWRHLKRLDALWTTPYGYALLLKLALVAGVLALGAHNWRRVAPTLGGAPGTQTLRRTARLELLLAGLVLVATAVLVSLPSPE